MNFNCVVPSRSSNPKSFTTIRSFPAAAFRKCSNVTGTISKL